MNRKTFLTAALIAATVTGINAQVGINTDVPKATLDIVQPDQTVKGKGFRLDDGNQAAGKILTSDADGTGTWKMVGIPMKVVSGLFPTRTAPYWTGTIDIEDVYIDLPPGQYLVFLNVPYAFDIAAPTVGIIAYVRICLYDETSGTFDFFSQFTTSPFDAFQLFRSPVNIQLNNSSSQTKRYHLQLRNVSPVDTPWARAANIIFNASGSAATTITAIAVTPF
jgi:hypothetical protein